MKKHIARLLAVVFIATCCLTVGVTAEAATYIGISKAKSIALSHAGHKKSVVRFVKAKRDREDGRVVYEIEFRLRKNRRIEYEYEIDARTGKILDWDRDYDD